MLTVKSHTEARSIHRPKKQAVEHHAALTPSRRSRNDSLRHHAASGQKATRQPRAPPSIRWAEHTTEDSFNKKAALKTECRRIHIKAMKLLEELPDLGYLCACALVMHSSTSLKPPSNPPPTAIAFDIQPKGSSVKVTPSDAYGSASSEPSIAQQFDKTPQRAVDIPQAGIQQPADPHAMPIPNISLGPGDRSIHIAHDPTVFLRPPNALSDLPSIATGARRADDMVYSNEPVHGESPYAVKTGLAASHSLTPSTSRPPPPPHLGGSGPRTGVLRDAAPLVYHGDERFNTYPTASAAPFNIHTSTPFWSSQAGTVGVAPGYTNENSAQQFTSNMQWAPSLFQETVASQALSTPSMPDETALHNMHYPDIDGNTSPSNRGVVTAASRASDGAFPLWYNY